MEIQQPKDSRCVKNAGAVFNLWYHTVFCPKYGRKVLVGEVEQRQHILYATAQQYGGMLAKVVHDASWASFIAKLNYKAGEAGRQLVKVDPRGTSQRCRCGTRVPKKLSDREHVCTACGLVSTGDHVSAMEILRLGLSLQPLTKPEVRVCVG
jgi:IS605 OrfB family transposase